MLACSDNPSPTENGGGGAVVRGHDVEVEASLTEMRVAPAPEPASIRCDFDLQFRVGDDSGGPIRPQRLIFGIIVGADPTQPVDSIVFESAELADIFGWSIESGTVVPTTWTFTGLVPFGLRGSFEFRDYASRALSTPFELDCGPIPAPDDEISPPVIEDVRVTPATGTIEAGDPVVVEYDIASGFGLWETLVIVDGTTRSDTLRFNDALLKEGSRRVEVLHPSMDPLGSRLLVRVVATDATTQWTQSQPVQSAALTDTRPPADATLLPGANPGSCTPIDCQYYPGAFVHTQFWGDDPSGLGWAYVYFGDPAVHVDSVMPGAGGVAAPVGHFGELALHGRVTDRHGNGVDLPNLGSINVFVADTPAAHEMPINANSSVYADFSGERVWVDYTQGELRSFSLADLTAAGTITLLDAPSGVDFGATTLVAAIPDSSTLEIRSRDGTSARQIAISAPDSTTGWRTGGVVLTSTGTVLVALARESGSTQTGYVVEIDTIDGSQSIVAGPDAAHFRMSRSGDGSRVMLLGECGRIYDAATGTIGSCRTVADIGVADATGSKWIADCVVYDSDLLGGQEIPGCWRGRSAAPAADGQTYWLSSDDYSSGLTRSRYSGLIMRQGMVSLPPGTLSVDPAGEWAVVAGLLSGTMGDWRVVVVQLP